MEKPVRNGGPRLISCVMATGNRPEFVQQSVLSFTRQTYPNTELIVVDDGACPVGNLCVGVAGVRYIRVCKPTPTGTKLNLGIEAARGQVLQKWDDDDYHAPEFLEIAELRLPQAAEDSGTVVVWGCFLVLLLGERNLRHSGCGWKVGATLCFDRRLWRRIPFRDVSRSEDTHFLNDHAPKIIPVCAAEQYIVVRHGRNTWKRMEDGSDVNELFWNLGPYPKKLESLVTADQQKFYRALTHGRRPT